MSVQTRRVMIGDAHEDQKWIVYEGYIDGVPAVTKRLTVATAAYVQRPAILAEALTKLVADVAEYHANYLALKALPQ